MLFRRSMSLQTKFILGLAVFALSLGLFFGGTLFFHLRSVMLQEVSDKANLILAQADAVQDYVRRDLRPAMFEVLPPDRFIISAMSSSYISRHIMERLNVEDTHYYYRRVALNARNPESIPTPFERGIISQFRSNQALKRWEGDVTIRGEKYHLTARPVVYEQSCMRCHGEPRNAPTELLSRYGRERGFGYPVGRVSGLVIAGFPVRHTISQLKDITFGYLVMYLIAVVLFFAMVSVYFNKLVVHNLHNLTSIFRRHFSGPEERSIIERLGSHDEISGLVGGMEELAGHLNRTKKELEKYALNLEEMVVERTLELQQEVLRHRSDVNLFVNLLQGLNQSGSRPEMVSHAVEQIGRRFAAERVIYYCTVVSHQVVTWPEEDSCEAIPSFWQQLMKDNDVRIDPCAAYVPVKSQDCAWGLLGIHWPEGKKPDKITKEVLLALGQQLGIALENIHAINNLTHQKDMLQSVFEGISNPLMLLDAGGGILMANKWAEVLTENGDSGTQLRRALKKALGLGNTDDDIIRRVLQNRSPWEQSLQLVDGRSFWTSIYPIAIYRPEPDCVVLYARENTHEKRMLARLQLAEKLSAVGQLAAGLAHEINNPLGVIQCYTDILTADTADEQTRSDLEVIARHTRQAQGIVQNLLNFARPKASVDTTCNVNAVVTNIADVFRLQAAGKSARLVLDLCDSLPDVRGDAASLEQILTNLWLNAFDAVPDGGGRIRITTDFIEDSAEVLLRVADNGPGIPEAHLESIFDPFFTTKDVGRGCGLGLAVVYGLTGELGARIEVENRGGAVFSIYLPTTPKHRQEKNRADKRVHSDR